MPNPYEIDFQKLGKKSKKVSWSHFVELLMKRRENEYERNRIGHECARAIRNVKNSTENRLLKVQGIGFQLQFFTGLYRIT